MHPSKHETKSSKKPQQELVPLQLLVAQAEPEGGSRSLSYRQVRAHLCLVWYLSASDPEPPMWPPGVTLDLLYHYGLLRQSAVLGGHHLRDHLFFCIQYCDTTTLSVSPLPLPVLPWFSAPSLHFLTEQQPFLVYYYSS